MEAEAEVNLLSQLNPHDIIIPIIQETAQPDKRVYVQNIHLFGKIGVPTLAPPLVILHVPTLIPIA